MYRPDYLSVYNFVLDAERHANEQVEANPSSREAKDNLMFARGAGYLSSRIGCCERCPKWVTIHKVKYIHVQTNISSLLRERLSGPRPLRRAVDIVSKPRIWICGAKAVLLKTRPTFRIMGVRKTGIPPTPNPPCPGVILTLDRSVSSMYAMRKSSDIEE